MAIEALMTDKTGKAIKDALASIQQAIQQQVPGGQVGGVSISVETDPETLTTLSQSVVYFLAPGTWTAFSPAVTVPAGKFGIAKYGTAWAVTVLGGGELASAIAAMTAADELTGDEALPMGSGESVTVQQLAEFAEGVVGGNAAHVSGETADQAKLASVGKVEELIGEGRRVVPVTSTPTTLDQTVIYLVHDSDEDVEFGTETVLAGTTARVYYDGNGWVAVTDGGTPTPEAIMAALEERLDKSSNTSDPDNEKIPTTAKVEEMIGGSGAGVVTDSTIDSSNPSETSVPTSKAVVDYVLPKVSLQEPKMGNNILFNDNPAERKSGKNVKRESLVVGQPLVYEGNSSYNTTGRIPVIGGCVYYYTGINSAYIFYLDADDNYIGYRHNTSSAYHKITIPVNAMWIRISYPKSSPVTDGKMVTFGEDRYATNSSSSELATDIDTAGTIRSILSATFNTDTREVIPTSCLNIEMLREILTADHQYDYWKGKCLFVDGDSISDYSGNQPYWQQHVANNLRMQFKTVNNIDKNYPPLPPDPTTFSIGSKGFGGTRLCPVIENGNDNTQVGTRPPRMYSARERCLTRRIAEGYYDNVNADLFIIFIGTNDWNHGTDVGGKLGDISDPPFAPTKDTEATEATEATKGTWTLMDEGDKNGQANLTPYLGITFYGCLKYLVEWFIVHKPKADLVLVTPIKRDENVGGTNHNETSRTHAYAEIENGSATIKTQMLKLSDYAKAIKEVGELYGVPVCDLFSTCFMNPSTGLGQNKNYPTTESVENINAGTQLTYYFDKFFKEGSSQRRDTTHPGPEGHKKIGRLVTGFLKSLC